MLLKNHGMHIMYGSRVITLLTGLLLPKSVGAVDHTMEYAQCNFNEIKGSVAVKDGELHRTYQEYFQYNFSTLHLREPQTRTDALINYEQLVAAAQM